MITNEYDNPLIDVLQAIDSFIDQMQAGELQEFDRHWQALLAYTEQPDSTEAGMLHHLYQLVVTSPTLEQQSLHILVSEMYRFTPRPDTPSQANASDGMAPVRDEVLRAVHQLGGTIRKRAARSRP